MRRFSWVNHVFTFRHYTFVAASLLAIQVLLWDSLLLDNKDPRQDTAHVDYTTYAEATMYRMVLAPQRSEPVACEGDRFKLHDVSGLLMKESRFSQKLGETQIHLIGAYLDDRLDDRYARMFGFGLSPGRDRHLYCNYVCQLRHDARFCSVRATTVMVVPGNISSYFSDRRRRSAMDVYMLSCPLEVKDKPTQIWLTTEPCRYSHNTARLQHFDASGVVAPPWELGVCVRPIKQSQLLDPNSFSKWLEFIRLLGADEVNIYLSTNCTELADTLRCYSREPAPLVRVHNWTTIRHLEDDVIDEASLNHCLYEKMMTYRYVVITSPDQWLAVEDGASNLKTLVRSRSFRRRINKYGGFRIPGGIPDHTPPSLIIKSSLVLAVASGHFVPLRLRPSFRILPDHVIRSTRTCSDNPKCARMEDDIERLLDGKKTGSQW